MPPTAPAVLACPNNRPDALRAAVAGLPPDRWSPRSLAWPSGDSGLVRSADAVALLGEGESEASMLEWVRAYRLERGEAYQPLLWLAADAGGHERALAAGADAVVPLAAAPALLGPQLDALMRVRRSCDRLRGRADEAARINGQLQEAYRRIDQDMELTRRIQRSVAPRVVPQVGNMRFAVSHRPRSRVGGDFFDVLRVDEEHVALCLGDALGRSGAAGSLVGIFVKMSITAKEIVGRSYRLVPPAEVLRKVNRELMSLGTSDPPVVTLVYFQCNCRDGRLEYARAGHPAPVYVPAEGDPVMWAHGGTFLGLSEQNYLGAEVQLRPGDKVLLTSDGVRADGDDPQSPGHGARLIESVGRHRELPVQAFVDAVARDLLRSERLIDDLTLVGLEFLA